MGNVLTATIKVNTEGVSQAFNNTANAANKTKVSLQNTDQIVHSIIKDSANLTDALNKLSRQGLVSINTLESSIQEFRVLFRNATDPKQVKQFGDAISVLTAKQKELTESSLASASSSGAVTKGFSALRTLANILPGIGIAGLFSLAFEGIDKIFEALTASINPANQALGEFNEKFASIAGSSIANIELLKAKINDSNTTQKQRVELVKDYNKVADEGNQIDLKQIGNLDLINEKILQQVHLLEERAKVKAAENVISGKFEELFKRELDVEIKFPGLNDILSKATNAVQAANEKLKIRPQFDVKELLALVDLPKAQLDNLAKGADRLKALGDPETVRRLQNANKELKNFFNSVGGKQAFTSSAAKIFLDQAQDDVDQTLALFAKLLSVEGFSEQTKAKIVKAFEGINAGIVKGLNDTVQLLELNPHKLSLPFQVLLDENKLTTQFSNVKAELDLKLHQFDFRPNVIPVTVQFQITADPNLKNPKALSNEITKQFADARSAPLNLSGGVDLTKIFNTDGVQKGLEKTFQQLTGIDGELEDIGNRGDFQKFAQGMQKAAELMTTVLQPAFEKFFEGVVNGQIKIKNFLDGLLGALKQVIAKLLTAAALAAIVAAFTGSNFFDVFKSFSGFKEKGGEVNKGNRYVVNERGREMFQPSGGRPYLITGGPQFFTPPVSGKIIPNWQTENILKNFSTQRLANTFSNTSRSISGRRATGGNVVAGNTYVVNEVGREIFVPNTGQAITVNSPSGGVRAGTQRVEVFGAINFRGKDLVAVITNTNRTLGRTT